MSERVRQSLMSSLFASKRFVVAACAAVAMVLGALSGGASFFGGVSPAPTPPEHSSLIFGPNPDESNNTQTPVKQSPLTAQHTLAMRSVLVPAPTTTPITPSNKPKTGSPNSLSLVNNSSIASTVNALFLNEVQLPIGNTNAAPTTSPATSPSNTAASTDTQSAPASSDSPSTTNSTTNNTASTTTSDSTSTTPPDGTGTPQASQSVAPFAANNTTQPQPPTTTNP